MQTELLERRLICVMKNTLDGTNGMLDMAEKFEDIKMKHIQKNGSLKQKALCSGTTLNRLIYV